ncbi:hypothetical protein V6N12_027548 [Hibiscus sabdariffa]|uniref:Oxidoreductase N-terminal domain-containing protein n=1 Tax=Hibiscus sabdariffa TaxID=183260 RepID=A0ABR2F378_9ROSI
MADVSEEQAVVSNKQVIFKDYISRFPEESDMFITCNENVKLKVAAGSKDIVVKNLYLSCDPFIRVLMSSQGSELFSPYAPGTVMTGYGVAKVMESGHPEFRQGDFVWGMVGWEEYSVLKSTDGLFKIHHTDVPLSYYTGILGMPGLTAYAGFYEVCKPKGNMCLFRLHRVLSDSLSANLLSSWVATSLVVLELKTRHRYLFRERRGQDAGRGACEHESPWSHRCMRDDIAIQSNSTLMSIVSKGVRMEGFPVFDYYPKYSDFLHFILPYIRQGKVKYVEDIAQSLDKAPAALVGLFHGRNVGKQVVLVAPH